MEDTGHIPSPTVETSTPQEALTFAYLYGFPIYAYALYVQALPSPKVNVPYPYRKLTTSEDHAVVRPNVDTLYTPLFYDVSQEDLEFEIPEFDDRYWLWPWYDMYGNNFGNISSLQGFKPGKYLLRYTQDNFGVHPASEDDEFRAYINSPTPYGMLLNRILLKHRTLEDLAIVHSQQDQMLFTPKARESGPHKGIPPLDLRIFSNLADSSDIGQAVLNLTALLSRYNPPEVLSDRAWIAAALEKAGISPEGTFTQPEETDLSLAVTTANTLAITSRNAPGLSESLGNNWTQPAAIISGDFQSFYAARIFSAQRGYLILTRDQAAYPGYTLPGALSGSDRFTITKDEAYIVRFPSGQPQLKRTGFWSLTIYGEDQYLIPNELGRHNIGDRSGLIYEDGTPINNSVGKEFRILIQAADVRPQEKLASNWLPAPSGGGTFMMSFRFYGAEESMLNGTWEYPLVTKAAALRR